MPNVTATPQNTNPNADSAGALTGKSVPKPTITASQGIEGDSGNNFVASASIGAEEQLQIPPHKIDEPPKPSQTSSPADEKVPVKLEQIESGGDESHEQLTNDTKLNGEGESVVSKEATQQQRPPSERAAPQFNPSVRPRSERSAPVQLKAIVRPPEKSPINSMESALLKPETLCSARLPDVCDKSQASGSPMPNTPPPVEQKFLITYGCTKTIVLFRYSPDGVVEIETSNAEALRACIDGLSDDVRAALQTCFGQPLEEGGRFGSCAVTLAISASAQPELPISIAPNKASIQCLERIQPLMDSPTAGDIGDDDESGTNHGRPTDTFESPMKSALGHKPADHRTDERTDDGGEEQLRDQTAEAQPKQPSLDTQSEKVENKPIPQENARTIARDGSLIGTAMSKEDWISVCTNSARAVVLSHDGRGAVGVRFDRGNGINEMLVLFQIDGHVDSMQAGVEVTATSEIGGFKVAVPQHAATTPTVVASMSCGKMSFCWSTPFNAGLCAERCVSTMRLFGASTMTIRTPKARSMLGVEGYATLLEGIIEGIKNKETINASHGVLYVAIDAGRRNGHGSIAKALGKVSGIRNGDLVKLLTQ